MRIVLLAALALAFTVSAEPVTLPPQTKFKQKPFVLGGPPAPQPAAVKPPAPEPQRGLASAPGPAYEPQAAAPAPAPTTATPSPFEIERAGACDFVELASDLDEFRTIQKYLRLVRLAEVHGSDEARMAKELGESTQQVTDRFRAYVMKTQASGKKVKKAHAK